MGHALFLRASGVPIGSGKLGMLPSALPRTFILSEMFSYWFWREDRRERFVVPLTDASLVDHPMCPDRGSDPQPWCIGMLPL